MLYVVATPFLRECSQITYFRVLLICLPFTVAIWAVKIEPTENMEIRFVCCWCSY